jgi:hypothetical protein
LGFVLNKTDSSFAASFRRSAEKLEEPKMLQGTVNEMDKKVSQSMDGRAYDAWYGTAQQRGARESWAKGLDETVNKAQGDFQDHIDAIQRQD